MSDLSQRIAALSPAQQALLKLRLNQKHQQSTTIIPKRDNTATNNMVSFAQQRMWFQDQLSLKSAVSNNISIALKISGCLQVTALEQSLREIIARHEILRTMLQTVAGELTQEISPLAGWMLPVIDMRSLPPVGLEREVQRITTSEACLPFNLATDFKLRTALLQLAADEHILLLTMHHIAVDAWSIGVFFRELSALYRAFSGKQPSPLAPLPIQYADFAVWQRQYLQGNVLDKECAYWKQKLHLAPDLLQLPSDRRRPSVQSFAGKTISFDISKTLTDSLRKLSQQAEATLFMTLLAAVQTLLFRYTNQDDILVGSPIANRQQPEIENLIGCFINTLVLRTDLSGNPSFRELLIRVRETVLAALAHQIPFEKLVDELHLARNLTYAPLFQVMLVLQNAFSIENIELPGLAVEHSRIDNYTAQFDLTFHLVESDNGLIGKLEYNTDLFDESTIVRMLAHFQTLLAGIVANPNQTVSQLPLLTPTEQQQLRALNQTTSDYSHACIHELFAAQVQKTPDAVAVISGDQQLTYQQLDQRANQLAHYLQKLGVAPECLVGICVERSILMLVGLLGILKAGGAYVPLDPSYPRERLELILSDAQVSVLLTTQAVAKITQLSATTVFLDADWQQISLESTANVDCPVRAQNLCYAIYTSGSTGRPKGVLIQHDSLVNFTQAAVREYDICAGDRVLQFASISFDAAAEEIFPCLTQGATLRLRTDTMLSSMAVFLDTCRDWQLTVIDLPTAFWHQLVSEIDTQNLTLPDSIRLVIIGGETAWRDRLILWQKCVEKNVRLVNTYGPTEATIVTTTIDLSRLTTASEQLPIGKPIGNTRTYILDSYLQPAPIGVPGELYIGGSGVARGYLHQPDLTAQAFIRDIFSNISGARLYKTGDRVRFQADGNIEFLGRIDRQVKLRGFRIELGEIETLLTQHPQVQENVVLLREDATAEKQLVAYVVPVPSADLTPQNLRRFLESSLPKYMVPAAFVLLDALPRNPSGKVDRQALPIPKAMRLETVDAIAPRSSTAAAIANIFAEVLNTAHVGIDDDFFEVGGHSLLATKLIARLQSSFQVDVSIVDLFESPTVAGLAARIDQIATRSRGIKMLPCKRTSQPVPLSFSQQYIWQIHHSGSGAALNSSIVIRIKDSLAAAVVEQSLNEIVRRHEILRTVFQLVDNQPMQIVLPSLHLPLVYADLQSLEPEVRESEAFNLAMNVAQPAFDLQSAPLMRTALFQLTPQENWLVITMHHMIADGASFGLLLHELKTLIAAFAEGLASPLADVPLQYADFALWQQRVYDEAAIAQQLDYWQRKLSDDRVVASRLFGDRPRSKQAKRYFSALDLAPAVQSLSRTLGVTSFVIMLAGLKLALAQWSRQQEVWTIATVGNRTIPQTESMLGCFINDVILRSHISPEQTAASLIQQLHTDVNEAIAHKDVPLERVIEHTKRSYPLNIMASVTITSSAQNIQQIPNWEVLEVQTQPQFENMPSQLYADDIPLEFYIEMSQTLRIGINYSVEQFTVNSIEQLLAQYQAILKKLVIQPEITGLELFETVENTTENSFLEK